MRVGRHDETLAAVTERYATEHGMPDQAEVLRWSGADLPDLQESGEVEDACAAQLQEVAGATGDFDRWGAVYERFLRVFPAAAVAARESLLAAGVVGEEFLAIAFDEAGDLVPLSLTPEQLRTQFPEWVAGPGWRVAAARRVTTGAGRSDRGRAGQTGGGLVRPKVSRSDRR